MYRPANFTTHLTGACALALVFAAAIPATAQTVTAVETNGGQHAGTFEVPVNKSQVLRVDQAFGQALIGNPDIADIMPLTSRSLYRSEEHTSELQSLMRISYAVFCLKKK